MYPLNYKPISMVSSGASYTIGYTQIAFTPSIGVTFAGGIKRLSASEIYKPFTKIFWSLLIFYLKGGHEILETNSGSPPYFTYDANNEFVNINFDAGMGSNIYEITLKGENYLKLIQNIYQNDQVLGSDLKMLLYSLSTPISPYGSEFYFLKCWEFLGVVSIESVNKISERGYLERPGSLTKRGYEIVRSNVESIIKSIKTDIDKSRSDQIVCKALTKIINPDEWGGLLPLADHKVASYISDLLFSTMNVGE